MTELDWMRMQLATLYRLDGDGRLRCVNEPGDPPAPRVFLGRTADGNLWRARHDLPAVLAAAIDEACAAEPVTARFDEPPRCLATLGALLAGHGGAGAIWRGPAFRFTEPPPWPDAATEMTMANVHLLGPAFDWLGSELAARRPCAAVLVDGVAAAVCFSSRYGEHAAEAGLETRPELRGRGYGTLAAAAWAGLVWARGLTPLYSTAWENRASRAVAARLGLQLYGEDCSIA